MPLLLLCLYLSYQAGITLFTHVHYVNGVMIVHSHPSQDKKHSHTTAQYLLIHQLSQAQTLEACASASLDTPERACRVLPVKAHTASRQQIPQPHTQLRAPPSPLF